MSFSTLRGVLAADVAQNGTFSFSYPAGTTRGDFVNGDQHQLMVMQKLYSAPVDFTIAFGATTATITWLNANTLLNGYSYRVQLDQPATTAALAGTVNTVDCPTVFIDLDNPIAGAATGIAAAQLLGAAGNLVLSGAQVNSAGVGVLDVPRNVTLTVATTNQSGINFTVYGTDVYGAAMAEVIAGPNANTVGGVKAFKTVTKVAANAAIATNGVSVGFGNVLGFPVHVPIGGLVLKEIQDNALATAGTIVPGLNPLTKALNNNADVRGTYLPNATPDGSKSFSLVIALPDPSFIGAPQAAV
jgi:hypothetical protein